MCWCLLLRAGREEACSCWTSLSTNANVSLSLQQRPVFQSDQTCSFFFTHFLGVKEKVGTHKVELAYFLTSCMLSGGSGNPNAAAPGPWIPFSLHVSLRTIPTLKFIFISPDQPARVWTMNYDWKSEELLENDATLHKHIIRTNIYQKYKAAVHSRMDGFELECVVSAAAGLRRRALACLAYKCSHMLC